VTELRACGGCREGGGDMHAKTSGRGEIWKIFNAFHNPVVTQNRWYICIRISFETQ